MARTTPDLVKGIIEVNETAVPDLTPFIDVANSLVTELCEPLGYTTARLELIERWLSAHFYAVRDPRARSEGVSGIQIDYEGQTDLGLNMTRYGQQAMLLDTKGALALINQQAKEGKGTPKPSMTWMGKTASEV